MPSLFRRIASEFEGTLFSDAAELTFAPARPLIIGSSQVESELLAQYLQMVYSQPVSRFYELGSSRIYYVGGRTRGTAHLERVFGPPPAMVSFFGAISPGQPMCSNKVEFASLTDYPVHDDANKTIASAPRFRAAGCAVRSVSFTRVVADMAVSGGTALEFSDLETTASASNRSEPTSVGRSPMDNSAEQTSVSLDHDAGLPRLPRLHPLERSVKSLQRRPKPAAPQFREFGGFLRFDATWAEFATLHADWLESRLREGDVVYRLPAFLMRTLQPALGLDPEDVSAEARFDELCLRFRSVGVCNGRTIPFDWLVPKPRAIADGAVQKMDWAAVEIPNMQSLQCSAKDVPPRLAGIIGRRICDPAFLADRDRLRAAWQALPSRQRSPFPLYRTSSYTRAPDDTKLEPAPALVAEFLRDFDNFCREWRLSGMATWDLPHPEGPMWPELRPIPDRVSEYSFVTTTPPEFPLLAGDGLGTSARNHQRDIAVKHGVADLMRWQTYARVLEIDHWERVLRTRYADATRPRSYVTFLEATIGQIIKLDAERVREYRKQLRALKSGRRNILSPRH
jgi:hypothetical protein